MRVLLPVTILAAACGRPAPVGPPVPPPTYGVAENLDEARRHDQEAAVLEQAANEVAASQGRSESGCGDPVLADQASSGGERLISSTPCWSRSSGVDARLRQAATLRADAAAHRSRAAELVRAEQVACAAFSEDELHDSAFLHVDDVLTVTAVLEGDQLRGARVRFRAVTGLTADWLRASIYCQQARAAALGWEPTDLTYDPTTVFGAGAWVTEQPGAIQVEITADDAASALTVYHRAETLLLPEE